MQVELTEVHGTATGLTAVVPTDGGYSLSYAVDEPGLISVVKDGERVATFTVDNARWLVEQDDITRQLAGE